MSEEPTGAILQRDKKTYAIVPRIPMGMLTPEVLEKIAAVARKYKIPIVKISSGQRIVLVGIPPEDVDKVWAELGMGVGPADGPCVHYVQACPGTETCKFGQQDSLGMAARMEALYVGQEGPPAKTKIAVSGCKLSCAESWVRDFGLFGTKDGWSVVVGGNSGGRPRIGDLIAEDLSDAEAVSLMEKAMKYYIANAKGKERMPRFIQRIGIEEFKKVVLETG